MRVRGNQSAVPVIGHDLPPAIDNYAPQRSYLLVRIGIDLGGTKIEGLALAGDGREVCRRRITAPRGNYDHTVRAINDLVTEIEAATGERGSVGVGIPGAVSPATGLIKNANSTWLIGKPFERDLSRSLNRPVRLANDANCFALSEATDGAAAGAAVVFGVIIGTGTGGGLVVHQQVVVGANAIAGEWGHNPLPAPDEDERPGPQCYCGRRGCIETFLSGPALSRDFAAHGGANLPAIEIAALADGGDAVALAALDRYERRFAKAIASVINVIDPDVIVLGGGLSNIERLYERVPRLWGAHVFSDRVDTKLRRATHGDASGVRGAAWLWNDGTAVALQ
jgi:fructokinase